MFPYNLSPQKKAGLVLLFCGSILLTFTNLTFAGGPPPQTQPTSEPDGTSTQPMNTATPATSQSTPAQTTTKIPPRFPLPSARVKPGLTKISLKLVNKTNTLINYQVIGDTQQRTLGEKSQVVLENIKIPVNMTYQRADGGFLLVFPNAINPNTLELTFTATNDSNLDTKTMEIQTQGGVFLN